jgi:hypothetical protein
MQTEKTCDREVISADDVAFFDRTGWFISDLILDHEVMNRAVEAAERIYEGQYDRVQPWSDSPHIQNFRTKYDRAELRVDQFPSFHSDPIRAIVHSPEVAAIAAALLKTAEVRYYKDILIGAPTSTETSESSIAWHTDESYWRTCVPEHMITVYVPLQDRDERTGTLLMITGSNHWSSRSFNLTAGFNELDKIRRKYEKEGRTMELQALPHRKGQVSFHCSSVIHATYPNVSDIFQHSVVFGLQAKENRFIPSPLKRLNRSLVVSLNDEIGPKLPDGTPDLKNDDFYPVLYRSGH